MQETLYDDTYTGPRYTYGLTYRPLAGANVPKGWIVFSDRPHPDYGHGTVDYPAPLTKEQTAAFQLTPLTDLCFDCGGDKTDGNCSPLYEDLCADCFTPEEHEAMDQDFRHLIFGR